MREHCHAVPGYAGFIGLRYSFSRKLSSFTTLTALVSTLGMVLGVAALITVLSVMNGFGQELRGRILSLVPHGYIEAPAPGMTDWRGRIAQIEALPGVVAAAPYITEKVIFTHGRSVHGGVLTGIDPALEGGVSRLPAALAQGSLAPLAEPGFSVVLGAGLAQILRVGVGDMLEVTVPRLTITPLGSFARNKRLTVAGIFEVGAPLDSYQAYVGLAAGQRLLGAPGAVDGLQVKTRDLFSAPRVMRDLAPLLPADYRVVDWSQTQGSLFRAVKMEKIMVALLLLSVVAVAAFNIVSTLVMSVAEKRQDIAVLRTLGARAGGIMLIFVCYGLMLAALGIGCGVLVGVLLAKNIAAITLFVENLFGVKLFDPSVYYINELPSILLWPDVAAIVAAALLLSLLATLYPAWRATRVAPAEVLRYE